MTRKSSPDLSSMKDEELLKLRICDLGLEVENSDLKDRVSVLHQELAAKKLLLKPKVYIGDEWFSPEGMVAIAVPLYLAHPRLMQLEKKFMLEVEGGTPDWCQKLLRHEAGHCFDHAYGFSKRKKWRDLFGSPSQEYAPENYRPRPYSKSYVRHLDNWYAQAHPDEDFAETFAVWLTPDRDWKKEYASWPIALAKLNYIEELAKEVREREPKGAKGYLPFDAAKMKTTLEKFYARRRREHAEDYPDFYDDDLKRIFNGDETLSKREFGAARFMARNRKLIIESVSEWSGEKKFTVDALVKKLLARCNELDLKIGNTEEKTAMNVAAYLATLVTNYLFTGKFKRNV